MKKTDVTQPVAMATPFAEGVYSATSTDDFEIPAATSTTADDSCVMDNGFLPITSTALDDGGKAPERKNFNGMFYLSTDQRFFLQNGGFITYNPDVATAIGGYPQDAILDFIDSNGNYKKVRSLIDDNSNNFIADETLIDGTNWEEISMGGGSSRNIGEIVASTIPLTDAGLHLLDGSLIQGSGIYSAFVDYITGLVTDYPNLFCTEADWQTSVTNYGVCGKFVYDNVNNTVRLPKITGMVEGTTDLTALGDLVAAGLPNITGTRVDYLAPTSDNLFSGAFYKTLTTISGNSGYGSFTRNVVGFDASKSNSIYGNSSTVQPQAIKVLYYIVIATSTKTDIEVDIDEIVTDLNGKADVDLTNITNTASTKMAHNAMLSNTKVSITIGAAGTQYTAPADGYYWATGTNGYIYLTNESVGVASMTQLGSGVVGHCNILVKKGDVVTLWYQGSTMSTFYFVYAEGSKWEAQ